MTDSTKRKIAALLKMTRSAGCSEAEAMAAAAKAAILMAEHGWSEADIVYDKETVRTKTVGSGVRDPLWNTLGQVTNTAVVFDWVGNSHALTYVGRSPGPEVAVYLYTVLNRAIDAEVKAFKQTRQYSSRRTASSKRAAVHDFTWGMVLRLILRLKELFAATTSPEEMASARNAVSLFFASTSMVKPRAAPPVRNQHILDHGFAAGGRPQIAHGMTAGGTRPLIGGGT